MVQVRVHCCFYSYCMIPFSEREEFISDICPPGLILTEDNDKYRYYVLETVFLNTGSTYSYYFDVPEEDVVSICTYIRMRSSKSLKFFTIDDYTDLAWVMEKLLVAHQNMFYWKRERPSDCNTIFHIKRDKTNQLPSKDFLTLVYSYQRRYEDEFRIGNYACCWDLLLSWKSDLVAILDSRIHVLGFDR